jgi:hypothetical protein
MTTASDREPRSATVTYRPSRCRGRGQRAMGKGPFYRRAHGGRVIGRLDRGVEVTPKVFLSIHQWRGGELDGGGGIRAATRRKKGASAHQA